MVTSMPSAGSGILMIRRWRILHLSASSTSCPLSPTNALFRSTNPNVPLAYRKRWPTCKKIQPLDTYFRIPIQPSLHYSQRLFSESIRNFQTKHQSKLSLRIHLTEHVKQSGDSLVEVRALEDQYDFGEHRGCDRRGDIAKEPGRLGFGYRGSCDLERAKGV